VLRRVEDGPSVGFVHIPARPGLEAVGLGAVMVLVLILRPQGLTGGREFSWPFTRAIRDGLALSQPLGPPELSRPLTSPVGKDAP